jgi:hypothetical protein
LTQFFSQDCLYEFRENAEFIAFPDWDDLMFTKSYKIPYYQVLRSITHKNKKIAGFIVDRYMGYRESLGEIKIIYYISNCKDGNTGRKIKIRMYSHCKQIL